MQNIYSETRSLDSACCVSYGLTEEIMMENAATSLELAIRNREKYGFSSDGKKNRILILCGNGNNGADGYALARRLRIDFDVIIFQCEKPKSPLCELQAERASKCGTRIFELEDFTLEFLQSTTIIVDCIYGSGFHGELNPKIQCILNDVNEIDCFRIACDVPSGIDQDGNVAEGSFVADLTVTMGALKLSLFSDNAKDFVGNIICGELGVGRRLFENASSITVPVAKLLEESDMILPERKHQNVNKGSFGHAAIASGEKRGASIISASAALRFGAGLVSLVDLNDSSDLNNIPFNFPELMISSSFPEKTSALAFGMGLGKSENIQKYFDYAGEHSQLPCVVDADACVSKNLKEFLEKRGAKTVLTPHPKEFREMLKNCEIGEYKLSECVSKRPELIEMFCRKYPKKVLLVKGANVMIGFFDGRKFNLFVNPYGSSALAKGGSGDVLSGMIAALLAQKYTSLDATVTASLAHAYASQKAEKTYSMTPFELISLI